MKAKDMVRLGLLGENTNAIQIVRLGLLVENIKAIHICLIRSLKPDVLSVCF